MPRTIKSSIPLKNGVVEHALRRRITTGQWQPGQRLPTRQTLLDEFDTGTSTLQSALDRLIAEGFVVTHGPLGTFVAENPPHLYRYALAFPSRQEEFHDWSDWWTVLRQAAETICRSQPQKRIDFYYDINGHADMEDYQRLLADVQARRLAGVILLTAPHLLVNTPLLDGCPVPRVRIGECFDPWKIHSVAPDLHSFVDRAIEYAAHQSRRRPVFMFPHMGTSAAWRLWSEACRKHGMEPARWQLQSLPNLPEDAPRRLTQMMLLLSPEHRPDTIVIADDHFVGEVAEGLLTSNLSESELPLVISHANFPNPPRTRLPVTFLGFDSVGIIRKCIDVLDAQRRGEVPPENTPIRATFASEQSNIESAQQSSSLTRREGAAGSVFT